MAAGGAEGVCLMKAAVITRYGAPDVVQILDAPKPRPAAGEILVRVHAATVNRTDCGELRAHPFFMRLFYGLWRRCRKLLRPGGIFAATDLGPWWQNLALLLWFSMSRSNRLVIPASRRSDGFMGFLKERLEAGHLRAIIDRKYALAAIVDAYRYVETGQKVGIVVIDVAAGGEGGHS
jgi:NADPH:quinone reductase-like Zn-dependent oxidoreductase